MIYVINIILNIVDLSYQAVIVKQKNKECQKINRSDKSDKSITKGKSKSRIKRFELITEFQKFR